MSFSNYNNYKFICHNKSLFNPKQTSKNNILIEFYNHRPSLIAYSYFSNILAKKYKSKIISYHPNFFSFKFLIKDFIKKFFLIGNHEIYKSFGTNKIIFPKKKLFREIKINKKINKIIKKIKSNKDLLNLKIDNIPIGDLFYDEYLRRFNETSINLGDVKFINYLDESIELFFYWKNYIKKNNVKAIIHSHTCYHLGLPGRIGIFLNLEVYNVGLIYAYKLSKKNILRSSGFKDYPKVFKFLKKKINKNLHNIAKNELNKKFKGGIDTMQLFNQTSDFLSFNKKDIVKKYNKSKKTKVLIAAPCFTDAPHSYGRNLFNDFHEWLDFVGKISKITNYEWLIKLHPAHYDRNELAMKKFETKYNKFKFLPKYTTHNKIISNNISAVLTVYGSIAHEYPLFGIPVINSSLNNPHIAYSFSIHPKTKNELRNLLLNINKLKVKNFNKIKKEIYEYYYTRLMSEYFFPNYKKIVYKLKDNAGGSEFYNEWIKLFNMKIHDKILNDCSKFINSNKFRMLSDNTSGFPKLLT